MGDEQDKYKQARILIFGGTTEGRAAVETLDQAGGCFYYSTRGTEQQIESRHALRLTGTLETEQMVAFCRRQAVRLLIDAAHPFAEELHRNIAVAAEMLDIPVIRYERKYPVRDPALVWCDSYADACRYLEKQGIKSLLALSGVKTIPKLKDYWMKYPCWFRVLDRPESKELALKYGFPAERLLFWKDEQSAEELFVRYRPEAILTKESGISGYFQEKVEAARKCRIPVVVVKRPLLPDSFYVVTGNHGLRHWVERLLPGFFPLNSGFTTGSCACAASKAALLTLLTGQEQKRISITLPCGEEVELPIAETKRESGSVYCAVIKDAGDDPDVTNQRKICARVSLEDEPGIRFCAGEGVGIVTLPGLGLEVGEPAINPVPRSMMKAEIEKILVACRIEKGVVVEISVPEGEELARKTFNPKLGIVGGISIIGTSGVVRPFSSEAFVATIRKEIQVARALACRHLVINSGAKSERILKARFPDLIPQAFIHYGNYIGETLKLAEEEGIELLTMGIMIGKAVKLAEGNVDTHSRNVVMNRDFLLSLAQQTTCTPEILDKIEHLALARELWSILPPEHPFFTLIIQKCQEVCSAFLKRCRLEMILIPEES